MSYRRVTYQARLVIKTSLRKDLTRAEIADKLGFHKSTVSREIKRNTGCRGYRPKQAEKKAAEREASKHFAYKMNPILIDQIVQRLQLKWSPKQISNRLKLEGQPSVSTETIYKFIDEDRCRGGDLWKHLRRSQRRRIKHFPSIERRGKIKNAIPISERPNITLLLVKKGK